ncbi:hypothetical protein [Mesorhizobium sp. SP-1A]|uniref:hypothetical protein n=1 Tax=Mesorhizobium sp. SP-1A TaxID=3077840 RepID=UPI0028F74A31|nr:hypothetical protein [Mesorhizobium sp. SP-1A]
MITSKTADRLLNRAHELNAISEADYEAGFKQEAGELAKLAGELAVVSSRMRDKLDSYAKSALGGDNS